MIVKKNSVHLASDSCCSSFEELSARRKLGNSGEQHVTPISTVEDKEQILKRENSDTVS